LTDSQCERLRDLPRLLERAWADHRVELAGNHRTRIRIRTSDRNPTEHMKSVLREIYHEIRGDDFDEWKDERRRLSQVVEHELYEKRQAGKRTQQLVAQVRQARLSVGIQSN